MQKEINILGYSGSHLALLFESLTSLGYKGSVRIIMNDGIKRADFPFQTNINYEVIQYNKLKDRPLKNFVFCSNKPSTKEFLFKFFYECLGIQVDEFTNIVHNSSIIASSVKPSLGFHMEPLSVVSAYTTIGFGVSISRNCSIGHHSVLHDYCSIHPGANLTGHTKIGRASTIGPGTTIFNGITIGANSVVGGGSVVTHDLPDNVIAFGNPCQIIKKNNE